MPGSSIGEQFKVTTFGESHGPALGCIVDGCPPGIELTEADIQVDLDRRKPGTSKYATQRKEGDQVKILSGVFEGRTTGTAIGLLIENENQKSKKRVRLARSIFFFSIFFSSQQTPRSGAIRATNPARLLP